MDNKLNIRDKNSLKEAINLQKQDCNEEALFILNELIKHNPNNPKIISFLGLFLAKTENYDEAIPYLEKARVLKPKNELIALSLYIGYTEQGKYKNAFNTLFNYLEEYPANLFKDTLAELMEGLLSDYGNAYKDKILFYSKKNSVPIPDDLDNLNHKDDSADF